MKKLFVMALLASSVNAQPIEEIVVLGSNLNRITTDTQLDFSLIETISIDQPFTQGGMGGFSGFRERGAQTIHTTVYRNGMPVNDPSTGWYDFGHIIPTGQEQVTVSHGSNSTLYGSGSLGGTVFIEDNITPGFNVRGGTDSALLSASTQRFNIAYAYGDNGSVMNTNNERDLYENFTARYKDDYVSVAITDYSYDYDDCWGTDDCQQQGVTGNISLRNEYATIGYSFNDIDFYTADEKTYTSKADNLYFDTRKTYENIVLGVTYNNGTSGVGATLTLATALDLAGGDLDGDTDISVGDRVIVNGEATAAHNGIYVITSTTVLTRAEDFDTPTEMAGGDFIFVTHGTTYANTGWVLGEAVTAVGTDAVDFVQFSGAGTYTAGSGLTLTGTAFSVNVASAGGIEISAGDLQLKASLAGDGLSYTAGVLSVTQLDGGTF